MNSYTSIHERILEYSYELPWHSRICDGQLYSWFSATNLILCALIDQCGFQIVTTEESSLIVMIYLFDQEWLFFQSMNSPQSSSKSMVIHLLFMLLIAIEHTTILKTTKSSKSHIKSVLTFCHVITPLKIRFIFHILMCIQFIKKETRDSILNDLWC